ncbi:uncharacterized protein [Amphiura filiformis]|uniref:uncharacterized protein n=1 Tax=Amphiura filiformis TaxID=82378 RepID=UPI003B20E64F
MAPVPSLAARLMPSKDWKKKQARKRRYEAEKAEKQQGLLTCLERGPNPPDKACVCQNPCQHPCLETNKEHTNEKKRADQEPDTETLHQATRMTSAEPFQLVPDSAVIIKDILKN